MRGYKHLNEQEFNEIKKLQEVGVPKQMAVKIKERSYNTISAIFEAGDFDDYRETISDRKTGVASGEPMFIDEGFKVMSLKLDRLEKYLTESVEEILEQLNNLNIR